MLCLPALIYLIFSFLGLVGSFNFHKMSLLSIIASIAFILVWTWLLNFLCIKKHETISWILLLLPLVLFLAIIAVSLEVAMYNSVKNGAANLPRFINRHH